MPSIGIGSEETKPETNSPSSQPQAASSIATSGAEEDSRPPNPCSLFAITQFECTATSRVTCWPLERVFRKCGAGPAVEVTNRLVDNGGDGVPVVDPQFLAHPPRGKIWADIR